MIKLSGTPMPDRDPVRSLCVFGALSAIVWGVHLAGGEWDKSRDWLAYELIGAALVPLAFLPRLSPRVRDGSAAVLGLLGLGALAYFVWWTFEQVALVGALAFLACVLRLHRPGRAWLLESVAVLAFWVAAVALVTVPVSTFAVLARRSGEADPFHPLFLPTLLVASWLVAGNLFGRHRPGAPRGRDLAAAVPLALASARSDYLLGPMAVHHWSAYLSAPFVVRHGGWLLWDTPSQYGFLSTLAISALPGPDLWQGFFALNAAVATLSALLLFLVLRSWGGPLNYLVALASALAFELWVPGWDGALATPSGGPLRFIWCQALLFVLWLHHRSPSRRQLLVGTALWVAGCLWSAESMFYCSLTWLPAYAWISSRGEARLWLPPVALAAAVGSIVAWYGVALGHPPDATAFVEYVVAFRHFYISSIAAHGPGWVLFLVICLAGTALVFAGSPLTLATAAASWAVASYFVGNCIEVTATNLLTLASTILAILGYVARERSGQTWSALVRLGVGTVVVVVLAMDVLANRWVNRDALAIASYAVPLESRRNFVDERLVAALRAAGAASGDPMVLYVREDQGKGLAWTPWLPFASLVSLMPIPLPRQEQYWTRYLERHPVARGWLVESSAEPNADAVRAFLARTYRVTGVTENGPWRVTGYERSADGSARR